MDPASLFDDSFAVVATVKDFGADFALSFGFGAEFDAGFGNFNGGSEIVQFNDASLGSSLFGDGGSHCHLQVRHQHLPNRHYHVVSVTQSAWYRYFTCPGRVRDLTREISASDWFSQFHHFFRMPLSKVEELTNLLMERGYVPFPRTRSRQAEFKERTELLVMSSLYILGTGVSFRSCQPLCYISTTEVRKFFFLFLDAIIDMKDEQISMPSNLTMLRRVESYYTSVGLPGCCGSIDVVHVKWANCPTGDFNRAKGKESYPTLGFECITDFKRRIMSIYGPHFGSRNDMDIVKTDQSVLAMRNTPLFRDTRWRYYSKDGQVRTNQGMYLICDNGYLRWPTTICPFKRSENATAQDYFTTNLESIRKDVECTFGILKKRWRILSGGFFYRDIKTCEKIFVTCCWLHNFLLDLMDGTNVRICRGAPASRDDGVWLSGEREEVALERPNTISDRILSEEFSHRRIQLVEHLYHFRLHGPIAEGN